MTQTMLLLANSASFTNPAICGGASSLFPGGITSDQRGFRLDANCSSGQVDVGAVQTNYLIVTNTSGTTDGSPDCKSAGTGTACSLADAINAANVFPLHRGRRHRPRLRCGPHHHPDGSAARHHRAF